MRQMFRIEEIIVVSIEHFIDWPAKIIDVLYYQNQIQDYDICLFHTQRVRKVVPLKCLRKIDRITTPKLSLLKNTTQEDRFWREAWIMALKQLEMNKSKYKISVYSTKFKCSQDQIQIQPQKVLEKSLEKKGFTFFQYRVPIISVQQLEKKAKALREKTLDLKYKNGSQFYLLKRVLEFKQLFLAILSTIDKRELVRVMGIIQDVIKISLLIKKQQTEIVLILTDLTKIGKRTTCS